MAGAEICKIHLHAGWPHQHHGRSTESRGSDLKNRIQYLPLGAITSA